MLHKSDRIRIFVEYKLQRTTDSGGVAQNITFKKYNNMNTLTKTNYNFPNQTHVYHGKVRDVYSIGEVEFNPKDIVRHKLVQRIVEAYEKEKVETDNMKINQIINDC